MIANISSSEYAEAIRNEYNEIYFKHQDLKGLFNFNINSLFIRC
jgi:hypothetical protein